MKSLLSVAITALLLTFVGVRALADENKATSPLDPIKALAGRWQEVDEGDKPGSAVEFKVTAAGGSVVETMFPGTPYEMVNVYTVDGDDVIVTHYCASKNAPRMKLTKSESGKMLFEFIDGTNIKPDKSYMGKLELTVHGQDEIEENWTSIKDGQNDGQVNMKLKRVK